MGENKENEIPAKIEELPEKLSGGWFNFRLVERENDWCDVYYEVYEVYYYANGEIWGWTEKPMELMFQDYYDVKETIKHIRGACKHTVLKFVKNENDNEYELVDTNKYMKGIKHKKEKHKKSFEEYIFALLGIK